MSRRPADSNFMFPLFKSLAKVTGGCFAISVSRVGRPKRERCKDELESVRTMPTSSLAGLWFVRMRKHDTRGVPCLNVGEQGSCTGPLFLDSPEPRAQWSSLTSGFLSDTAVNRVRLASGRQIRSIDTICRDKSCSCVVVFDGVLASKRVRMNDGDDNSPKKA